MSRPCWVIWKYNQTFLLIGVVDELVNFYTVIILKLPSPSTNPTNHYGDIILSGTKGLSTGMRLGYNPFNSSDIPLFKLYLSWRTFENPSLV